MTNSKITKYAFSYLWLITAVYGMALLVNYSTTKGSSTQLEKKQWPIDSRIERDIHPTLVMFVHPFCPCSLASVGELERLMPFIKDKVNVNVVFISLKNMKGASLNEWKQTNLYKIVDNIPGVNILRDDNETEAKLFGAETSGHTAFFDHKGKLIFTGGLTPARGHMGDSIGRTAIIGWIQNNKNDFLVESSVFGCALRSPASNN
jgi:hypothetical protein